MAKKRVSKKRRAAKRRAAARRQPTEVTVKIEVEPSASTPIYYMNYAEISHGAHDFVLSGVRVPAKFGAARREEFSRTGILNIEPEVQITFPPTLIRPLIEALEKQADKFEARQKGKSHGKED